MVHCHCHCVDRTRAGTVRKRAGNLEEPGKGGKGKRSADWGSEGLWERETRGYRGGRGGRRGGLRLRSAFASASLGLWISVSTFGLLMSDE